ncbi:tigger transposable element-derived protein 1-like [Anastrepha obliqua]|uniref:tigger transposable element-derived protein 1-like n=1 Tax=Anastrepha obliqua TaxID=95512 RepID=UPI00240946A6|nr:tigger transposable element-derived protein 1-like [Anastrepha obliqua]
MSGPKRREAPPQAIGDTSAKRRRRCLTIEDKIKLLDRLKAGERPMDISRDCEISDSTIRSLLHCEVQLRKYAEQCTKNTYRSAAYIPRDEILEKMEQQLYGWYLEQRQQAQQGAQTISSICAKAREIYTELKKNKHGTTTAHNHQKIKESEELQFEFREFKASKSWFMKFRKRYNLEFRSIFESETVDLSAVIAYPATFAELVQSVGYQPHQVFTAVEFSFAWKRMPNRTFIAITDKSRDKVGYDRISLLFCSNAEGNFYVKPMLIHRSRTPYCLRTTKISELPVFWRSRGRQSQGLPKVTPSHFHDWLTQCFTPTVRNYLQVMEMPEHCLLLLGSNLKQMVLPAYDDSFLRVEFLPPNTSQLLQPLTQSLLPIFQCKYLRSFLAHLVHRLEVKTEANLYKAWQKYSIADAIDIIQESLDDISVDCWKSGWHRLWPEIVREPFCDSQLTDEVTHIAINGRQLPGNGFADMTIDDIKQHLKLVDGSECAEKQERKETSNETDAGGFEKLCSQTLAIPSEPVDPNENDELISFCSEQDLQSEGSDISVDKATKESNHIRNGMLVHIDNAENEKISGFESEEEAVIEFHQTEGFSLDENSQITEMSMQHTKIHEQKHGKARKQIQLINKAFNLTEQLLEILRPIETSTSCADFAKGLDTLMLPYKELKRKLLQPSIKDYFSK